MSQARTQAQMSTPYLSSWRKRPTGTRRPKRRPWTSVAATTTVPNRLGRSSRSSIGNPSGRSRLVHQVSAVDDELGPGDERRLVREQEPYRGRDLVGTGRPRDQHPALEVFEG